MKEGTCYNCQEHKKLFKRLDLYLCWDCLNSMKALKLSETQQEALQVMKEKGGKLIRWDGGYWTFEGAKAIRDEPEWHCGTTTIRSLYKKGYVTLFNNDKGWPHIAILNELLKDD